MISPLILLTLHTNILYLIPFHEYHHFHPFPMLTFKLLSAPCASLVDKVEVSVVVVQLGVFMIVSVGKLVSFSSSISRFSTSSSDIFLYHPLSLCAGWMKLVCSAVYLYLWLLFLILLSSMGLLSHSIHALQTNSLDKL